MITDSAFSPEEILKQNPNSVAPDDVVRSIKILVVTYLGYDGEMHQGQIAMHKSIADDVNYFFDKSRELKFPIEKVIPISAEQYAWSDETSCADNNSSGYNFRYIHGTNRLSKHAEGRAFDINPIQNIYIKYDADGKESYRSPKDGVYDPRVKGTLTADHPLVIAMKERGWIWGGDWTRESGRIDYQHFER